MGEGNDQHRPDDAAGRHECLQGGLFTAADGQRMSSLQAPTVAFPTFSPPLPLGLAGTVNGVLGSLQPLVPDVLTGLGVSIEGATLTSWPVVCSAPQLVR